MYVDDFFKYFFTTKYKIVWTSIIDLEANEKTGKTSVSLPLSFVSVAKRNGKTSPQFSFFFSVKESKKNKKKNTE